MAQQRAARSARDHALAVLRARNGLIAVALLPAAVLVVVFAAGAAGHLPAGWTPARVVLAVVAQVTGIVAVAVAVTIARARPAVTPTIAIPERDAPELHAEIRDLALRLDVPEPGGIALTPDCDSWLEEPAARPFPQRRGRQAPVLVIGSPFLWWMRVPELRALLAPVVAGTGPSRHPDVAAARRCVRGLDAAAAAGERASAWRRPRVVLTGRVARLVLRMAGQHAAEMERGVAAAAAARARPVDAGLRATAQEQVGLAYAGWDRLLTRVASPAWRLGRWPRRLNAGVVSSLTELSRRDRLAEGYASRLRERPASDLLAEPVAVDAAISLLAARLFHGPDVGAAANTGAGPGVDAGSPAGPRPGGGAGASGGAGAGVGAGGEAGPSDAGHPDTVASEDAAVRDAGPPVGTAGTADAAEGAEAAEAGATALGVRDAETLARNGGDNSALEWSAYPAEVVDRLWRERAARLFGVLDGEAAPVLGGVLRRLSEEGGEFAGVLAARLTARVARDAAERDRAGGPAVQPPSTDGAGPLGAPAQLPVSGADLLAQHVAAAVCCVAIDTTGARPGLDWLDGPVLETSGGRLPDLERPAYALVEDADPGPLREWLRTARVATDQLVRLA